MGNQAPSWVGGTCKKAVKSPLRLPPDVQCCWKNHLLSVIRTLAHHLNSTVKYVKVRLTTGVVGLPGIRFPSIAQFIVINNWVLSQADHNQKQENVARKTAI